MFSTKHSLFVHSS